MSRHRRWRDTGVVTAMRSLVHRSIQMTPSSPAASAAATALRSRRSTRATAARCSATPARCFAAPSTTPRTSCRTSSSARTRRCAAGDVPDELRPWLYRLTRNRAIDEVRRKRWGDESLDSDHAFTSDAREDPDTVLRRKEAVRRLIEDLADLPVRQREALLARELDDQSPEQVAAQLGVSVMAVHKLTSRARENLIKTRDARDAACPEIRGTLLDAHERGARPSEHGVRHVKGLRRLPRLPARHPVASARLQALNPALGLPLLAGIVKLAGGGGAKTAAGRRRGDRRRRRRRDRRHRRGHTRCPPIRPRGAVPAGGHPRRQRSPGPARRPDPDPNRDRHGAVDVPAGRPAEPDRDARMPGADGVHRLCRAARRTSLDYNSMSDAIPRRTTNAHIYRTSATVAVGKGTIGIVCRRPDANGSLAPYPRKLRPGERLAHRRAVSPRMPLQNALPAACRGRITCTAPSLGICSRSSAATRRAGGRSSPTTTTPSGGSARLRAGSRPAGCARERRRVGARRAARATVNHMVNDPFRALSHPIRRGIVERLAAGRRRSARPPAASGCPSPRSPST